LLTDLILRLLPTQLPRSFATDIATAVFWPRRGQGRVAEWPAVVELLALVAGIVAGVLGLPVVTVVCVAAALLLDSVVTRSGSRLSTVLDFAGWGCATRALLRWVVVLPVIGAPGLAAFTFLLAVGWLALVLGSFWLSNVSPMLHYVPGGSQPATTLAHARVYRRVVVPPPVLVAAELVAVVASLWFPILWPLVLACGLVCAGYGGWGLLGALRLARRSGAADAALIAEVAATGTATAVHVSGGSGQARYVAGQWDEAFAALPVPPLWIVREANQLAGLAPMASMVVLVKLRGQLEALCAPTVRVVFLAAHGQKNFELLRIPGLATVFLGHGDSDKVTSFDPVVTTYDQIWVAGPVAIERYRRAGIELADDRFVVVGRPQVEKLPVGPTGNARPVVLYAPTFEGYTEAAQVSSLAAMGAALVQRLLAEPVTVWFRPHPSAGVVAQAFRAARQQVNGLVRTAGAPHWTQDDPPPMDSIAALAGADVLIADVSSMASDFLQTERPIIAMNPLGLSEAEFRSRFPAHEASYIVSPGLDGLDAALRDALGPDPLREARIALKKRVLGDLPDGPLQAFVDATARLVEQRTTELSARREG